MDIEKQLTEYIIEETAEYPDNPVEILYGIITVAKKQCESTTGSIEKYI